MAQHGKHHLDGGWWPQSRDLPVELADLIGHLPTQHGRVARALFSPPDWEPAPRRIPVAGRYVKVGSFPRDDTHLMLLKMADGSTLRLLVVPPDFSEDQGDEALLAASSRGNAHSALDLLETVTNEPEIDRANLWK